ncbi:hypothetical protein BC936DRAFT_148180 [Jimgerdemannia flammicorona]|uniref:Endonuclease/exonuclease/phosphatase domain-containing protein n=1 Tax=Jimgerdemannia flammicorona TaxID=994334 RepID=A0A433D3M6_9FUNG|nr:hypothetical protein BC936DRAFT_148180 [Jimgerdemannia flammicorona]
MPTSPSQNPVRAISRDHRDRSRTRKLSPSRSPQRSSLERDSSKRVHGGGYRQRDRDRDHDRHHDRDRNRRSSSQGSNHDREPYRRDRDRRFASPSRRSPSPRRNHHNRESHRDRDRRSPSNRSRSRSPRRNQDNVRDRDYDYNRNKPTSTSSLGRFGHQQQDHGDSNQYKSPQTQYRTTEKKFSQSSSNNDTITREWAAIAAASQADLGTYGVANFKVTCYNILADSCFQKTLGLYKHHSLPDLAWQYRWPVILRELQALQSDIYFIQVRAPAMHTQHPATPISPDEMDIVPYKNQALPAFQEMGYEGLYKKRLPAPPDVPVADDGCALFVKRNRFEIESFKLVDYQERGKYLSKGNVGIVAILREVTVNPPPRICVGNTHLYYNRNRGIMKLGQLDILFKAIEEELRGRVMPIIICGDMNSTPGSIVDTFIRTGYVDMSAIDEQYISGQVKDRSTATTAGQRTATSSYYSSAFTWTSSIPANPGQSTAEPVPPGSYIPTLLPPPSATSLTPLLIPITRSAMVLNREAIWQFRNKLPVNSHNYSSDVADPDPILTHPFVFNSVYSYDDPALYTTNNSGAEKRGVACDFIYVGGWRNPMSVSAAPAVVNVATKEGSDHRYEVQPVARLDIPVQQLNGLKLPNMKREIASDHIPLAAEFAFMKV